MEENEAREQYYAIWGTPSTWCDGVIGPWNNNFSWQFEQRTDIPSPVMIQAAATVEDSIFLLVDVTSDSTFSDRNLRLRCVLIELVYDSLNASFTYTHFEFEMLDMAPDHDGFAFDINPAEPLNIISALRTCIPRQLLLMHGHW